MSVGTLLSVDLAVARKTQYMSESMTSMWRDFIAVETPILQGIGISLAINIVHTVLLFRQSPMGSFLHVFCCLDWCLLFRSLLGSSSLL
jgi:hypothetical protein